jgi:hypothetical protein
MKKSLILTGLIISFIFISCKPTSKEAIAYNDAIVKMQTAIVDKINVVMNSFNNYVAKEMDAAYENASNQVNKSIDEVKKMKDFDGTPEFKDESLKLFSIYKSVLEKEYTEMIKLYKLPEKSYGKKEIELWEKYNEQANKKMNEGLDKFRKFQIEFSKKYEFKIEGLK